MLTGELAPSRTEQDTLLACLANGTLSGAEKTRALNAADPQRRRDSAAHPAGRAAAERIRQ